MSLLEVAFAATSSHRTCLLEQPGLVLKGCQLLQGGASDTLELHWILQEAASAAASLSNQAHLLGGVAGPLEPHEAAGEGRHLLGGAPLEVCPSAPTPPGMPLIGASRSFNTLNWQPRSRARVTS